MSALLYVQDSQAVIDLESLADGITQSEMQMWDNCAEKWYLRYNLRLAKKDEFNWATTYGGWIHSALEEFYQSRGKRWKVNPTIKAYGMLSQYAQADAEYYQGLAKIQMEFYASYYKHDFDIWDVKHTEFIVDLEYRGVRLKGMVDLFVKFDGGYYVVDHKTSYALNKGIVQGWDFRFQFMFYCWLAWRMWGDKFPIKGFFINAMKKPQLRRGKTESIPAFLKRVKADMLARPEMYLYRERVRLRKGALIRFQKNILDPKIDRVKLILSRKITSRMRRSLMRNKNTDHCMMYNKPCQFFNACRNGLEIEKHAFIKRAVKHQELEEEAPET